MDSADMDDSDRDGWGMACTPTLRDEVRLRHRGVDGSISFFSVRGIVFGAWAVHPSYRVDGVVQGPDPDAWSVTHMPTGHSMAGLVAEPLFWDAVRIARALDDSGIFSDEDIEDGVELELFDILCSVVGAALHDHYVWPFPGASHG